MEIEYKGIQVEVEVINHEIQKERHGAFVVIDESIDLDYQLPTGMNEDAFEDFVHSNHIESLIEIYNDEQ